MFPIGNHQAFIEGVAAANPPIESFQHSMSELAAWRGPARRHALALLRYAPESVDLAAEVLERRDFPDYVREKVAFNSAPGSRVPAYVLLPKQRASPAPAIVALHCHGGYYVHGKEKLVATDAETPYLAEYKQGGYDGVSVADALAKRGYVVVVIDAFYFGERRVDFRSLSEGAVKELQRRARFKTGVAGINEQYSLFEETMARHVFAAGATWMGILSHDDRATVSYLCSRPEVDPDRIGCLGLSMGGMRTNWLHATDTRIKAAVSIGWMTDWRELLPATIGNHSWAQVVPGLTGSLELSDLAVMGEGAFMAQSCERDALFTPAGMRNTAERIARLFEKAGERERFATRFYDVPHMFSSAMQVDAFAWLDRHLKA